MRPPPVWADGCTVKLALTGRWWRRGGWLAAGLLLVAGLLWLADRCFPLPLPSAETARVVLAEDGTPLWRFADADGVWRYAATREDISPYYVEALLAYEDRWFWQHPGINPVALGRAGWLNLRYGRVVSGGSTISMQVARLLDPHPRTLSGKLRQVWRTLQLEWHFSKEEILELYLNRAPFGGVLEGVAAASWTYLGKSPADLSRAEAALLAVLPQAPSRLRPDRHPELARQARDKVLQRMAEQGIWSQAQVDEALAEPVYLFFLPRPQAAPLLARRLVQQPGAAPVIRTTIDGMLQLRIEQAMQRWKASLPPRVSAAVLVIEHDTMAVRAYAGSVDFLDVARNGQVDMVTATRSPGSTLKPFLFSMALDEGLIHSSSLLQDVPRHYGEYRPQNFAADFSGPVSAAEALSRSLNLPSVQLLEAYGPARFAGELREAGLPLRLPAQAVPNLSLILGGAGSSLEQLVAAYSIYARGGRMAAPRFAADEPLREHRLVSPGAAWITRQVLSGRLAPDQAPVDANALAWKTGTSYGFRDAWAVGVGPRYLIGVWVGRPDGAPVAGQFGQAAAAPLLFQVHRLAHREGASLARQMAAAAPPAVGVARICWPLGQPMPEGSPDCRQVRQAWVLDGVTPPTLLAGDQRPGTGLLLDYWLAPSGRRVAADCPGAQPARMVAWPLPLEPWLPRQERLLARLPAVDQACPPPALETGTPLVILGVREGDRLRRPARSRAPVTLNLSVLGGSGQRWWYMNGNPMPEQELAGLLKVVLQRPGRYRISLLDEAGQTASVSFEVVE